MVCGDYLLAIRYMHNLLFFAQELVVATTF